MKEEISLAMERRHSSFVSEAAIPVLRSVLGVAGTADQSLRTHSQVRKTGNCFISFLVVFLCQGEVQGVMK